MNKKYLFLFFALIPLLSTAQGTWTKKANITGPRHHSAAFTIGNKIYLTTGVNGSTQMNDVWEFDPAANSWTKKKNFPGTSRSYAVAFTIKGKGYLGCGMTTGSKMLKDFWEYDPETDTWTQKADYGGTGREHPVAFVLNDEGYIGCGSDGTDKQDFWKYSPTANKWTKIADFMGTRRHHPAGFVIGNKAYVGTGHDYTNAYKKDFYVYDPVANAWSPIATFPGKERVASVGVTIGETGYIFCGGDDFGASYEDCYAYDASTNKWSKIESYPGNPTWGGSGCVFGNKAYFGTGLFSGKTQNEWYEYTPSSLVNMDVHPDRVNKLTLYPNPSNGVAMLNGDYTGDFKLSVYTMDGRLLDTRQTQFPAKLEVREYPKGYYLLKVDLPGKAPSVLPLIKQ